MRVATQEIGNFIKESLKTGGYKVTFVAGIANVDLNRLDKPIVIIVPNTTELRTTIPTQVWEVSDTFLLYVVATNEGQKQTITEGVVNLLLNLHFQPSIEGIQPKHLVISRISWTVDTETQFQIAQVELQAFYLTP